MNNYDILDRIRRLTLPTHSGNELFACGQVTNLPSQCIIAKETSLNSYDRDLCLLSMNGGHWGSVAIFGHVVNGTYLTKGLIGTCLSYTEGSDFCNFLPYYLAL